MAGKKYTVVFPFQLRDELNQPTGEWLEAGMTVDLDDATAAVKIADGHVVPTSEVKNQTATNPAPRAQLAPGQS